MLSHSAKSDVLPTHIELGRIENVYFPVQSCVEYVYIQQRLYMDTQHNRLLYEPKAKVPPESETLPKHTFLGPMSAAISILQVKSRNI